MKLQRTKQIKRESALVKVGAGWGAGSPAGSLETEGSRFPDVLRWGSGKAGLDVAVLAWGGGPELRGFPEPEAILLYLPNQIIKPIR